MSRVLVVNDGKRERELLLVERLVVGRDPTCDISYDDGLLSRRHAEFIAAPTAVMVRDLGSRNGVFVNGTRRAEQALSPGDVVQIGPLRVRYLLDQTAGAPASRFDADGTLMIPATSGAAPSAPLLQVPPAFADFDLNDEGETRMRSAAPQSTAAGADSMPEFDDAMSFTPTPRPGRPLAAAVSIARAEVSPSPGGAANVSQFVLTQLGALAGIVFVATVTPIVVSRGTVLAAISDGQLTALLLWPILPLGIGLAATLVIANSINRRVLDVLTAEQNNVERR